MRSLWMYAAAASAAVALAWWLVFQPRINLSRTQLEHTQQQLADMRALDVQRVEVINAQNKQLSAVLINEQRNRELLAQINSQSRAQTQALTELKRNDKKIMDYLDQPVPAELGRLYQRSETTNPVKYRQPPNVRTDLVPTTGTASPASK